MCALLVALTCSVESEAAVMEGSFVWGFGGYSSSQFPECGRMHIKPGTMPSITAAVKPPYTMIAYEAGGMATAQTLGSDPANLWWTVDHKAGAQLALSMADAAGNSGGISPVIYTVFSNSSTNSSCHSSQPESPLSLTTNMTNLLSTCDVLYLNVAGGKKPYTVTIASTVDAQVSNFTLGDAYDTYHYVSKNSPNSTLIATVSDAAGTYSLGTLLVNTTGSLDHSCNGAQSMQLDSTGKAPSMPLGNSGNSTTPNPSGGTATGPIIGGVLGGLVILGAFITGVFFFFRKRKPGPGTRLDDDESSMRGVAPFRVNSVIGATARTAGNSQFNSLREKDLPPAPPHEEGEQPLREGQAVFQHADISDVVELPPAYMDRA